MKAKTSRYIKCSKNIPCKCNSSKGSLSRKNESPPSRSNSQLEARKTRPYKKNAPTISSPSRSASVPPRPFTRRNIKTIPHNYLTTVQKNSREIEYIHINNKEIPSTTSKDMVDNNNSNKKHDLKIPVPTPRNISPASQNETPECSDYEYLRFSLRITEDIIRNNLYNTKDMERVFNSHIEANRDRLDMKKMLEYIKQLQDEINAKKILEDKSECNKKTHINMLKQIIHQHQISEAQMQQLSEKDLQYVITGILNCDQLEVCSLCARENTGCFKEDSKHRQNNIDKIKDFLAKKRKSPVQTSSEISRDICESDAAFSELESSVAEEYHEDLNPEKFDDFPRDTKSGSSTGREEEEDIFCVEEIQYQKLAYLENSNLLEDVQTNEKIIEYATSSIDEEKELNITTFPQTNLSTSGVVKKKTDKKSNSRASKKELAEKKEKKVRKRPQSNHRSTNKEYIKNNGEKEMSTFSQLTSDLSKEESVKKEIEIFPQSTSNLYREESIKEKSDKKGIEIYPQSNSIRSRDESSKNINSIRSRDESSKNKNDKEEMSNTLNFTTNNLVDIAPEAPEIILKQNSDTQTILERYVIENKEVPTSESSRGSVDKNTQTTVRPRIPNQSNSPKKHSNNSVNALLNNINLNVTSQIHDIYKPISTQQIKNDSLLIKISKDNTNSMYKTSQENSVVSNLSEGELPPSIVKLPSPVEDEEKPGEDILKQLQKYETNSQTFPRTSITSYELSIFTEQCETYIPKFHRRKFFPDISTQTSLDLIPLAETFLSDGEVKNYTSESDDTKT